MMEAAAIVVPWVNEQQRDSFRRAWHVGKSEDRYLVFQHDKEREGCGVTKNKGVKEAMKHNAEIVIVLDDDCYPTPRCPTLLDLMMIHRKALEPQEFELFQPVTDPPSRGTPYFQRSIKLPVAASMGFWSENPDHCAVRQLAYANGPMIYIRSLVFWRYFPLCGMNLAFKPNEWMPWCQFIDVPRFDDIWMGWLWQREAYRRGFCFNLAGPTVRHIRQSNVWANLIKETKHLERNEILWKEIAMHPSGEYDRLRSLLPV